MWEQSINLLRVFPSAYTGCPRRNGRNFGRVFLMLNYTDITQNTYIQSWTVTEIMAREKCGLLGCPHTVRRPWRHTHPLRMPGNEKPLANVAMQWPWRDYASAAACVKCLVTLRTTMTWVRVFLYFNLMAFCLSQVSLMLSTDISITETTYSCQF